MLLFAKQIIATQVNQKEEAGLATAVTDVAEVFGSESGRLNVNPAIRTAGL